MLTENTVTKLQEMHLSAMAKAFKDQMTDPNMADMSFEDRFGLIVDHEWTTRKNNHLNRLIKNAGFAEPNACVEDIEYHADRNWTRRRSRGWQAVITSPTTTTSCFLVQPEAARPIWRVPSVWRR